MTWRVSRQRQQTILETWTIQSTFLAESIEDEVRRTRTSRTIFVATCGTLTSCCWFVKNLHLRTIAFNCQIGLICCYIATLRTIETELAAFNVVASTICWQHLHKMIEFCFVGIIDWVLNKWKIAKIQRVWNVGKDVFVYPSCAEASDVGQEVVFSLHYVAPLIYISQTSCDSLVESKILEVDLVDLNLV